jgi:hypothetical protein
MFLKNLDKFIETHMMDNAKTCLLIYDETLFETFITTLEKLKKIITILKSYY